MEKPSSDLEPIIKETVILGQQFGDEGKGKIVDEFAGNTDITVRFQGGANAGHTVVVKDETTKEEKKYVLHLLPTGILHEKSKVALGPAVVVDMESMYFDELKPLIDDGTPIAPIIMSPDINLVTNTAKFLDKWADDIYHIGTTARGIGPTYGLGMSRAAVTIDNVVNDSRDELIERIEKQAKYARVSEKEVVETLQKFGREKMEKAGYEEQRIHAQRLIDTGSFSEEADKMRASLDTLLESGRVSIYETRLLLEEAAARGERFLLEGAQGILLDIRHGKSPFVTSSYVANEDVNLGVYPKHHRKKIGVAKAYTTKVGNGPFPTKLEDEIGQWLRDKGDEYGATTKRPRDCGWFDAGLARYTAQVAGLDAMALTKLDVLSGLDVIKVAVGGQGMTKEELFYRTPEYVTLPGWKEDISGIQHFEDLPENAQNYVRFLEQQVGIPIEFIGTGPRRDSIIYRDAA